MKCCFPGCKKEPVVFSECKGVSRDYCEEHAHLYFGREVSFKSSPGVNICCFCGSSGLDAYFELLRVSCVECPNCRRLVPDGSLLKLCTVSTRVIPKAVVLESQLVPVVLTTSFVVVATSFRTGMVEKIRFFSNLKTYTIFVPDVRLAQLLAEYTDV